MAPPILAASIEILHGDAMDLSAAEIREMGIHSLITDPPYSPHVHESAVSCSTVAARGKNGLGVQERDLGFEPLTPELRSHIAEIAGRGVSGWSVIHTDLEGIHGWQESLEGWNAEYIRSVPWIRWSQAQLSGDRPGQQSEGIVLATAPGALDSEEPGSIIMLGHRQHIGPRGGVRPIAKRWNGPGSLTHFDRACLRSANKHPTEKPLDLALDLVCYFSNPGELVLDPLGGWGTVALACFLLGRDCLMLERNPAHVEQARSRVFGPLRPRDQSRAERWVESVMAEAESVPTPKAADGSDVKTWERAQRRIADVLRVAEVLS